MLRLWIPLTVVLSACAQAVTPPPMPRPLTIAADSTEYASYLLAGQGEIYGQAFLTTRGGDVKLAAGRLVTLDPYTSYASEWFRRFGADISRFDAPPPDALFQASRRTTVADAEGRFRFSELPAGEYLVRTTVTWETGARYDGLQGGVVAKLVPVDDGQRTEPIVNEVFSPDAAATLGLDIIAAQNLVGRRFHVIEEVQGVDCQVGFADPAPDELNARQDLIVRAARVGADAVTNVRCESRGMSLIPNCTSRIICFGDAISLDA